MMPNAAGVANIPTYPLINPPAPIRTAAGLLNNAVQAQQAGQPINGIKGAPPILLVDHLDPILPVDYTHDVCLRVMSKLINLWFDVKHGAQPFSIRPRRGDFNDLMKSQKAPDFIPRPPRGFDQIKHWKGEIHALKLMVMMMIYFNDPTAAEFRGFLIYWGPVFLKDLLPQATYYNFLCLSEAIIIYLGISISQQDLDLARGLIRDFLTGFVAIYGQRFTSRTIHSLSHLDWCVEKMGPLWTCSTFAFESSYHYIRLMIHGTRHVLHQLRHSAYTFRTVKVLSAAHLEPNQALFVTRFLGVSLASGYYDIVRRRVKST